jgi:hypothetical protein
VIVVNAAISVSSELAVGSRNDISDPKNTTKARRLSSYDGSEYIYVGGTSSAFLVGSGRWVLAIGY